ncbi:hypothetical protein ACR79U_24245 [Sphingobacterium siyangense]|uniref:hypothetical protein n=1 Tax=Sphingobacterium siyangense TaxID=459529 RepID=UPI003DA1E6E1
MKIFLLNCTAILGIVSFAQIAYAQQTNVFPTTGNVGIGVTNPSSLLHVNGEVRSKKNWITDDGQRAAEITPQGIYSGVGNWSPTSRSIHYELAGGWDLSQIQIRAGGSDLKNTIRLQTDWNGSGVDGTGGVYFGLKSTDTHVMLSNGNVGIGTLKPTERLSVNGKIRAHEIKVETTNWPDYVFTDEYQLPTLKETAEFIENNKHLPGVPKAAQVEQDGLSLGEMNRILLQKIEELTLHMIDKDRRIEALEKKLNKSQ